MSSYLPQHDGYLPKWLLFISLVSLANSAQAYISLAGTRQVYAGRASLSTNQTASSAPQRQSTPSTSKATPPSNSPVTPLSARTFGTWTAITAVVRLYAAYNISNPAVYELALWTFVVAWGHFMSEWLVFGSCRWGRGLAGPAFVATGTGGWMLAVWGQYVKG